jgi:hypothetical protein
MIAVKELNGKIHIALIPKAKGDWTTKPSEPGIIDQWFDIGPGQNPYVSWSGEDTYVITFQYMSQVVSRLISVSSWPPNRVDPVTYTPQISIQKPEVWVPVSGVLNGSFVKQGKPPEVWGYVKRDDPYVYFDPDTNIYQIWVSRDTTKPTPGDPTRKGYRLWTRPLGGSTWTLLKDWDTDFSHVNIQSVGSLKQEIALSWGELWVDGNQNFPDDHTPSWYEHPPVKTAQVNSDIESCTYTISFRENVQLPTDPGQNAALATTPNSTFWSVPCFELIPVSEGLMTFMASDGNSSFKTAPFLYEPVRIPTMDQADCSSVKMF